MRVAVNGTEIFIDIEGGELAVEAGGLAERPTCVVLPGGPGFDHGYLRPGLSPLAADAQLLYIDPRGCGRSMRPPLGTWTLEQVAADVVAVCRLLGIERPILFGHSAGGFVALTLALSHPEVARGLVLCNTVPALRPHRDELPPPAGLDERAPPEIVAIAKRLFGGEFSEEVRRAFDELVGPYYAGPAHMTVPPALFALSQVSTDVMHHFFSSQGSAYDMHPHLGQIDIPTLVLVGAHDWVCSPAASRAIASKMPRAELCVFETAGHLPFSEVPTEFQARVREFLAKL